VLRQFYGVLLFCVTFVATVLFARDRSEVRRVLRQIRWLILALSAYTIIFYPQKQGQEIFGFFKANISLFSATLAVYCAGEFLRARGAGRRLGWAGLAVLFLVHPILFLSRGAVGLAGITVLAGLGLRIRARAIRYFMVLGAFAFFLASVSLNLFAGLSHFREQYELLWRLVPADVLMEPDALSRITQLDAALDVARQHPLLGLGLGSTLTWYVPSLGAYASAALVDNGWAYILSKMGLLGMAAFLWFVVSALRGVGSPGPDGLTLGVLLIALFQLLYMMVGAIMVHFVYAVWAGVSWGLLYQLHAGSCLANCDGDGEAGRNHS
jgi:O-antigen ligase